MNLESILGLALNLSGAIAGSWGAAVLVNRLVYRTPDTANTRYPWMRMISFSIVLSFMVLVTNGAVANVDKNVFAVFIPVAIAQDIFIWGLIATISLAWLYYKKSDKDINALLNWGLIPFLWK